MQEMMFFATDCRVLWSAVCFNEKAPEFLVVRNQIVKGELPPICLEGTSPHAVTAVSGYGVKPGCKGIRALEFAEMLE
jgi:hypothetical protein